MSGSIPSHSSLFSQPFGAVGSCVLLPDTPAPLLSRRHRLPAERFDEFESRFAIDAESHWQIFRAVEGRAKKFEDLPFFGHSIHFSLIRS